jgi:hypothetical protein
MVQITLYLPNGGEETYQVQTYSLPEGGRLTFRTEDGTDAVDVTTTVPFLIRQPVKEKAVVREDRQGPSPRVGKWS